MTIEHQHQERIRCQIIGSKAKDSGKSHEIVLALLGVAGWICRSAEQDHAAGEGNLKYLLSLALSENAPASTGDCFWLIDEGLAMDWISMAALIDETDALDPDFAIFGLEDPTSGHSLNQPLPIARLKMGLARKILNCPVARDPLQDSGLAAVVAEFDESPIILEWRKQESFRRFFRPGFPRCENPEVVPGIHFPVNDPKVAEEICALNFDLAERMGSRVVPYNGNKARGWFVEDAERWTHWFGRKEPTRVLEIAATDGISTNAMLDLLFLHPESEVHTIHTGGDLPEAAENLECFTANSAAVGHTQRVHLYAGLPVEVLAWMIATDGYWESFDFIHFKPMPNYVETMTAVGQAWILLKPGGVMLLDSGMARIGESHPAKLVLETCARVIGNQADPLLTGDLIALKKRPPVAVGDVEGEMKP